MDNFISSIIIKIRKDNNLRQIDLAKELNVTPQAVSKWELGLSIPTSDILLKIMMKYNVSINENINNKKEKGD